MLHQARSRSTASSTRSLSTAELICLVVLPSAASKNRTELSDFDSSITSIPTSSVWRLTRSTPHSLRLQNMSEESTPDQAMIESAPTTAAASGRASPYTRPLWVGERESVAKSAAAITPHRPPKAWTATASNGSSTLSLWSST
eukprot:6193973-Pleurochrysis_carterae.AAC.1